MPSYYSDPTFQDKLLAHVARDRKLLKELSGMLTSEDFKPVTENGQMSGAGWCRWIIGKLSLDYYEKYRTPIRRLLRSEVLEHAHKNRLTPRQRDRLLEYVQHVDEQTLEAGESLVDKVMGFKRERECMSALQEILQMQEEGKLSESPDAMLDICRNLVGKFSPNGAKQKNFFDEEEVEARIHRRKNDQHESVPALLIQPLDDRIQSIFRGQIGVWLAPPGRGKSLACIHTAIAYAVQGYQTMLIECEDPRRLAEDRIDAALTYLPISALHRKEEEFRKRYSRMRRMIQGKLVVRDATEERCTFAYLEKQLDEMQELGKPCDALIVDYDGEMVSPLKNKERHDLEVAEIYRRYRSLCAKRDLYGWLAAQTKGGMQGKKIITMDDVADAQEKMRKATLVISIGNGSTIDEHAYYLWICKNKNGFKDFGLPVINAQERGVFFHREKTYELLERLAQERAERQNTED